MFGEEISPLGRDSVEVLVDYIIKDSYYFVETRMFK
jgi:hypothetical protein